MPDSSSNFLARLVAEGERIELGKPATFWACEGALRAYATSTDLTDWLNGHLRALVDNADHQGDWLTQEVFLHRGRSFAISVALVGTPSRYIHALASYCMVVPFGAVMFDRYRLPASFRNDVFDPSMRLTPDGVITISPREVLRVESDIWAYDLRQIALTPILRFMSEPVRPMEWLFSKSTLHAWQANDASLTYTQLRVAAYVLGKIAHHSSIEPLKRLSEHHHHAVRWAAIQNLGRLNRSEALRKIREAINDPHPHVRRAAQKTLQRLEGHGAAPG